MFLLVFGSILGFSVHAQTSVESYGADLLFRENNVTRKVSVQISQDKDAVTINGTEKKAPFTITLPMREIKRADYTYTQKPLALEAIGTTSYIILLSGYIGVPNLAIFMPMILTKKKRHWLVIEAEQGKFLFQLKNKDYRQLMLQMHNAGINIQDAGKAKKAPVRTEKP